MLGGGDKKAADKRLTSKAESQAWLELLGKLMQETPGLLSEHKASLSNLVSSYFKIPR